jgi:hypothetical protein
MRNILLLLFCTFFILLQPSCKDSVSETHGIYFFNNSKKDIYYFIGVADRNAGGSLYPDTLLTDGKEVSIPLKSNSYTILRFRRYLSNDTSCLFIYSADTLDKYSWEEIKAGYNILQRYDLDVTLEGLKQLNFEVSYPPTEAMKDVKMYPPYKE